MDLNGSVGGSGSIVMAKLRRDTTNDDHELNDSMEHMSSDLDGITSEFDNALKHIEDHHDGHEIVRSIAAAIIAQEMSRMTVTKSRMIVGDLSSVDPKRLLSDWETLARHYAGAKHEKVLEEGVMQLRKLTPSVAQKVIHEIRNAVESTVNWAMEEKTMKVGFGIPFVKRTGLGNFSLNFIAPQIAMRRFQARVVRFFVQCGLWLAVAFGTFHWVSWTIFDEPYLMTNFEGATKLTEFLLLLSTSVVVWALCRFRFKDFLAAPKRMLLTVFKSAAWLILAAGWCHLIYWFLFGIPTGETGLEETTKLVLPFYLISGSIAAWISGRIFKDDKKYLIETDKGNLSA